MKRTMKFDKRLAVDCFVKICELYYYSQIINEKGDYVEGAFCAGRFKELVLALEMFGAGVWVELEYIEYPNGNAEKAIIKEAFVSGRKFVSNGEIMFNVLWDQLMKMTN